MRLPTMRSAVSSPILVLLALSTSLVQTVQGQCCQDGCANNAANYLNSYQCFLLEIANINIGSLGLPQNFFDLCPGGNAAALSACTCLTASSSYCSSISSVSAAAAQTRTTTVTTTTTTTTPLQTTTTTTTPALPASTTTTTSTTSPSPPAPTTSPSASPSVSTLAGTTPNPFYVFTVTTPGYCSVSMVLYLTQITTYLPAGIATTVVAESSSSSGLGEFGCAPLTSTVIVYESSVTLGLDDTATVTASGASPVVT